MTTSTPTPSITALQAELRKVRRELHNAECYAAELRTQRDQALRTRDAFWAQAAGE